MFAFVKRYIAYRRLKPIVTILPLQLANAFGGGGRYTFLQVKRAMSDLKLHKGVEPYALAAACSMEELRRSAAGLSPEQYHRLRTELADVFDLPGDFTVKDLQRTHFSSHHPAEPSDLGGGGH
jgi:hypothetical protein